MPLLLYTCEPIIRAMGEEKASQTGQLAAVIVSVILLVPIFIYVIYYHDADEPEGGGDGGRFSTGGDCVNWTLEEEELLEWHEFVHDESEEEETFFVDAERPDELRLNLTWTDENSTSPRYTNEPDWFNMTVYSPTGSNHTISGDNGFLELIVPLNSTGNGSMEWMGEWRVVIGVKAGDHQSDFGLLEMIDDGNTFVLFASVSYYVCDEYG